MPLTINVHHHFHVVPDQAGDMAILNALAAMESRMQEPIEDVLREVTEAKDVQSSVVTLVGNTVTLLLDIKAQLAAAVSAGDLAAVQAAADSLDASTRDLAASAEALAAAVNTPPADPG